MTSRALVYAVRPRVVAKYVGQLCLPLALAMVFPMGLAVAGGSWGPAAGFAGGAATMGLAGWWAARRPEAEMIQTNEAMVVVASVFILAAAITTPALVAYGLSPMDAFFEAVSGVTTTGLTVLPVVSEAPWDLHVVRGWLQWYGGLGFVTLAVLLVTRTGSVARQLNVEETGSSDLAESTRAHGRRALVIYTAFTAAGLVLLLLTGLSLRDAVVHTFSSVSTGGFSTRDASLAEIGAGSRAAIALLFVLGALPLVLIHRLLGGDWRSAIRDPQLLGLLAMGTGASALLVLFNAGTGAPWTDRVGDALLMGFSAQTTTGFSVTDPGGWPPASRLVLVVAMFVGGCAGSTAGGIKVWRALVAFRLTRHTLTASGLPEHAVREPTFAGEKLDREERTGILILVVLFVGVIGLSWLAFLAGGHPPLDSLFDVVSAVGTVGLSTGVSGPDLSTGLKFVLCLGMLMGRLEILALLVLLAPGTWFGRRRGVS